jgi:hypothetical protein
MPADEALTLRSIGPAGKDVPGSSNAFAIDEASDARSPAAASNPRMWGGGGISMVFVHSLTYLA